MTSMLSGVSSMIRTVWADDITDIRSPTIPMPTGELFPAVTIPRLRRLPPAANPPQREGNSTITPATGQRPESFPASVSILGQSAGSDRNHRPLQLVGQEQAGIFRVLAGLRPQPQGGLRGQRAVPDIGEAANAARSPGLAILLNGNIIAAFAAEAGVDIERLGRDGRRLRDWGRTGAGNQHDRTGQQ